MARLTGSVTPELLTTMSEQVSTVVKRPAQSVHWRRRRIDVPSSVVAAGQVPTPIPVSHFLIRMLAQPSESPYRCAGQGDHSRGADNVTHHRRQRYHHRPAPPTVPAPARRPGRSRARGPLPRSPPASSAGRKDPIGGSDAVVANEPGRRSRATRNTLRGQRPGVVLRAPASGALPSGTRSSAGSTGSSATARSPPGMTNSPSATK